MDRYAYIRNNFFFHLIHSFLFTIIWTFCEKKVIAVYISLLVMCLVFFICSLRISYVKKKFSLLNYEVWLNIIGMLYVYMHAYLKLLNNNRFNISFTGSDVVKCLTLCFDFVLLLFHYLGNDFRSVCVEICLCPYQLTSMCLHVSENAILFSLCMYVY